MRKNLKNPESVPAIAARLRALRRVKASSQAEFAEKLGISPKTWNHYENAKGRIKIDTVLLLHRKWEVDPIWVYLGLEGNMKEPLITLINQKLREEEANDNGDPKARRRTSRT